MATLSTGREQAGDAPAELPLLPPWLRVARIDDRLLLEHGDAVVSLEGKAATLLLPDLLPLLDGTLTLAEIATAIGADRAKASLRAIEALAARGHLTAGPASANESARLAVSFGGVDATLAQGAERLESARVAVAGGGVLADEIARVLGGTVGGAARVEWEEPEEADLLVAAPSPAELPRLAVWNERMLELRQPWLQVLPFDGRAGFVGPLYLPEETGCHACFSRRRAEAAGEVHDLLASAAVPARFPVGGAQAAALAGLAGTVVLRWLAVADPALPGAAFALELADGPRVTRHRLLRVPRCHACSGTRPLPPPLPWAEGVER